MPAMMLMMMMEVALKFAKRLGMSSWIFLLPAIDPADRYRPLNNICGSFVDCDAYFESWVLKAHSNILSLSF